MKPTAPVSKQGKAAAGRIAEARQNVNNGQTPQQARATLREIKAGPQPTTPTVAPPIAPPTPAPANTVALTDLRTQPPAVNEAPPVQMQDFNAFIASYRPDTSREDAAITANRDNIYGLNQKIATKGQKTNAMDEAAGLPQMYDESAKLRAQIADLTGAFGQAIVNEEGVARPMEFITGRQAFLQSQKAAQIEALSAAQAAMDGNIVLAEGRIDRAIEREFGDYEKQLEAEKFDLTENKDALQKKDAKAYQDRTDALAERQRQLQDSKEKKKQILSYATEAASNGAPASLVSRITQATSEEEALAMAGSYVGLLDRQAKQASIAASQASASASRINSLLALAEAGDPSAVQQLGFDPNAVMNAQNLKVAEIVNNPTASAYTKNTAVLSTLLNPKSPVSATARGGISTQLGVINSLNDLAEQRQDGKFAGFNPLNALRDYRIGLPFTDATIGLPGVVKSAIKPAGATENEAYLEAINLKVQQWASGASLTDQQTEKVNRMVPQVTDTDAKVREKMNNLTNFMLTQTQSTLQAEGINFVPEKVNLFETYDYIKQLSPEQRKQLEAEGLLPKS